MQQIFRIGLVLWMCLVTVLLPSAARANGIYIRSVQFEIPQHGDGLDVLVDARCTIATLVQWAPLRGGHRGQTGRDGEQNGRVRFHLSLQRDLLYRVKIRCFDSAEGANEVSQGYTVLVGEGRFLARRVW